MVFLRWTVSILKKEILEQQVLANCVLGSGKSSATQDRHHSFNLTVEMKNSFCFLMRKSLLVQMLAVAQKRLIPLTLILLFLMVNHSHAARTGGVEHPTELNHYSNTNKAVKAIFHLFH